MRILRSIKSLFQFQMVVVMLLVAPASWAQTQEQPGPQEVVSHLQETLIKSMREGGKLGYRGRFELLAKAVDQTHDLDFIARTTLGANWTQLSAEQQRIFTDVFRKLSIGTYAGWFKSYEGSVSNSSSNRPCQGIRLWCVPGSSNRAVSRPYVSIMSSGRQTTGGGSSMSLLMGSAISR